MMMMLMHKMLWSERQYFLDSPVVVFSCRPVLKFAKYDTLNYKTPQVVLVYRVSYLGNF